MVRALGEQLDTTRDRVLVIDDNSPDGTGEIADALAAELPWVEVLHRPGKDGLGPAYIAGFRRALAAGRRARARDRLRLLPRPADVPRLIAACEAGADLALGSRWVRGRRHRQLGRAAGRSSRAAAASTRARSSVSACATSPAASSASAAPCSSAIDLDAIAAEGLRVPDRDDLPRAAGGLHGRRDPDHVRRPARRRVEDGRLDRRRGDAPGAGAALARAARRACSVRPHAHCDRSMDEVTDATFDERGARAATSPSIVDFGAPWCRPCKAIEPALERDRRRCRRAASGSSSSTSTRTSRTPSRYGVLSDPDGDPVRRRRGRGRRSSERRARASFERTFAPYLDDVTPPLGRPARRGGARVPHDRAAARRPGRAASRTASTPASRRRSRRTRHRRALRPAGRDLGGGRARRERDRHDRHGVGEVARLQPARARRDRARADRAGALPLPDEGADPGSGAELAAPPACRASGRRSTTATPRPSVARRSARRRT